jgi:hypothetical protein
MKYKKIYKNRIAGPSLTYADLALANFFDVAEDMVNPDCLKEYPTLKRFL